MAVVTINEFSFHIDGYMVNNLDHVKREVTKKDFDSFLVVTGREGYGKSTLAAQLALYLDNSFNLDRCTFTAEQFEDACVGADKYQAVVFDETMGYLGSRGAMSNFNRRLVKIMSEMRSKNLFVILCIPNFFELDRYPAIHRSTGLIRVYKRGVWELYNYRNKKMLYLKGKKSYSYGSVPANIRGRFPKCFILPKEAYEKKKQKAINDWLHSGDKQNKIKEQRNKMISFLLENNKANAKEISEIVGLSPDYIRKMRNVVPKVEEVVPKPQIVVPKEQIGQNVAPKGLIRQIPVSVPHSITLKKEMVSV